MQKAYLHLAGLLALCSLLQCIGELGILIHLLHLGVDLCYELIPGTQLASLALAARTLALHCCTATLHCHFVFLPYSEDILPKDELLTRK